MIETNMIQEIKANNLYEFIELTKVRPGMYLGEESLSSLSSIISGYILACSLKEIDEKLKPDFHLFHDFVANYYLYSESTAGWTNILLAANFGNQKEALKAFYKLFDLFRMTPKISNAKKILFKILDKLINGQSLTDTTNGNPEDLSNSLKGLADRLEKVEFSLEYEDILDEFEEFAKTDKTFLSVLDEIKTNIP